MRVIIPLGCVEKRVRMCLRGRARPCACVCVPRNPFESAQTARFNNPKVLSLLQTMSSTVLCVCVCVCMCVHACMLHTCMCCPWFRAFLWLLLGSSCCKLLYPLHHAYHVSMRLMHSKLWPSACYVMSK